LDGIRRELNKYALGASSDLKATPTENSEGQLELIGTGRESQEYQAKKMINQVLDFVENTLNESKINLTDSQFLDAQVLDEWRYQSLYNSQTALDFLGDYNNKVADLVNTKQTLEEAKAKVVDKNKNGVAEDTEVRHTSEEEVKNNEAVERLTE
jgi:hypothetical protein